MPKLDYEIAAEITQELIKARGVSVSGAGGTAGTYNFVSEFLSTEAAVNAYTEILKVVRATVRE